MQEESIIELSTVLVDNQAVPKGRTNVELSIVNSSGIMSVENVESTPRSLHKFTISDVCMIGYAGSHSLSQDQAVKILTLACSLTNDRVLFSHLQYHHLSSSFAPPRDFPAASAEVNSSPDKEGTVSIMARLEAVCRITASMETLLTTRIILDEVKVLDIVDRLLALRLFDTTTADPIKANVRNALHSYLDATVSDSYDGRYKALYAALEKSVNVDTDHKGSDFDTYVASITSLTASDVETLREFYNRIKHPSFKPAQWITLHQGRSSIQALSLKLKQAADNAILARI